MLIHLFSCRVWMVKASKDQYQSVGIQQAYDFTAGNSARYISLRGKKKKNVPLVEFMYLVFTRKQRKNYRRRLLSLLCLCDAFRELINSLVC